MDKKLIVLVIIFSVLSLIVVGEAFLYFKKTRNVKNTAKESSASVNPIVITPAAEKAISGSVLPAELSANFDPSVNAAIFKILSASSENKTLNLEIVWPKNWEGKKITSRITCESGDIKIATQLNPTPQNINLDTFFNKVQNAQEGYLMFSGLCSDKTCDEIYRQCNLNLQENK